MLNPFHNRVGLSYEGHLESLGNHSPLRLTVAAAPFAVATVAGAVDDVADAVVVALSRCGSNSCLRLRRRHYRAVVVGMFYFSRIKIRTCMYNYAPD